MVDSRNPFVPIPSLPLEVDIGVIELWSGSLATIPDGWVLCDGTNGTPDLRDQFSIAASPAIPPGTTADSSSHLHAFTSNTHRHTVGAGTDTQGGGTAIDRFTTFNPASGSSDAAPAIPPFYSLAYVMFIGH